MLARHTSGVKGGLQLLKRLASDTGKKNTANIIKFMIKISMTFTLLLTIADLLRRLRRVADTRTVHTTFTVNMINTSTGCK